MAAIVRTVWQLGGRGRVVGPTPPPRGVGQGRGAMTGERIRAARLARGWTQAQLARRVGVTQGGISGIERGRHGTVSPRLMARLLEVLELTPETSAEPGEDAPPGACPGRHGPTDRRP